MNNYNKIKNMNFDELAKWLDKYMSCDFCDRYVNTKAFSCMDFCEKRENYIKKWLLKEGAEDEND